jgi:hypothetical protein
MLQSFIVIEHSVERTKSDFKGNKYFFFVVTALVFWKP